MKTGRDRMTFFKEEEEVGQVEDSEGCCGGTKNTRMSSEE